MKSAEEWLNEIGETVANDIALVKNIQRDAWLAAMQEGAKICLEQPTRDLIRRAILKAQFEFKL